MTTIEYDHPREFRTQVEPTLNADPNRVQYNFDSLLARKNRTYYFVDYLFEKRPSGLHGAVGTRMSPVFREEAERMEERYRDPEESPLYHVYEETDPAQGWDAWIDNQFRLDGLKVIYDSSYHYKYGAIVEEKTHEEMDVERQDIAFVECIGGGRMFDDRDKTFDAVYDQELLRLVKEAEDNGLGGLY